MSKIKLNAKKGAPEFVSVGNLTAERKDGHFSVETREFADYIIAQGFATETVAKKAPAKTGRKTTAKTATRRAATQAAKTQTATAPAAKTDEPAAADTAETKTEGDVK